MLEWVVNILKKRLLLFTLLFLFVVSNILLVSSDIYLGNPPNISKNISRNSSVSVGVRTNISTSKPIISTIIPADAFNITSPDVLLGAGEITYTIRQNSSEPYYNFSLPLNATHIILSVVLYDNKTNTSYEAKINNYVVRNNSVVLKQLLPNTTYILREYSEYKKLECNRSIIFGSPITWFCNVLYEQQQYNVSYRTPEINIREQKGKCSENVSLSTKHIMPYYNLLVPINLSGTSFYVIPGLVYYNEIGSNLTVFKVPVLNKSFNFSIQENCSVINLSNSSDLPPTKHNQSISRGAKDNKTLALALNHSGKNIPTDINLPSPVRRWQHKRSFVFNGRNLSIITEKGASVNAFKLVKEKEFSVLMKLNVTTKDAYVSMELPKKLSKNTAFYLWKKEGRKYVRIPFERINSSKIRFRVVDGVIDDSKKKGVILINNSIKFSIPEMNVSVNNTGREVDVSIDNGSIKKRVRLTTRQGNFSSLDVVPVESTVNIPKRKFEYGLLKFRISNVSKKADITIHLDKAVPHPKIMKFNPDTAEWYSFPFRRIDSKTIRITIYDGGRGDDDGLKNGVIVDDLGITNNWWNDSWPWRRAYKIFNSAGNLTDYQFKLNLNATNFNFSKANSDGSDLRFTWYNSSSDTEVEMPYWMEYFNSSAEEAVVWVKTPFLENDTNTTIFVYYGNSTATSASNITRVFIRIVDGLVLSWHLDEGSGSIATDTSGFGRNGTISGASWTSGSSCKFGDCLYFDGSTGDYIIRNPFSHPASNVSVEFWLNTSDTANSGTPYSYAVDTAANEFLIYDYSDFRIYRNTSYRITGIYVNDSVWHHIVVTWRDSDDQLDFYKDNVDAYSNTLSGDGINQGGSLVIAQEQDSVGGGFDSSQSFIGYLDEIRIYNRTLTSSEISDLYNNYGYTTSNYPGKVLVRKYTSPEPALVSDVGEEYQGALNVAIDLPQENSRKIRTHEFVMNGTVNCSRGNCGNTSVDFQYYSTFTPLYSWSETTNADFLSYNEYENITVYNNALTLAPEGSDVYWWNTSWNYRFYINISSNSALTQYQTKLILNSSIVGSHFNWTSDNKSIRFLEYNFTSRTYTELPYWIEYWSASQERAVVWVKIPSLSANSNLTIFVYYGNPAAESASNITRVFIRIVDGLVLSWHLDEGSGSIATDTSGFGRNGTISGASWTSGSSCKFGDCLYFDGSTGDYIIRNPFSHPASNVSVEFWLNTSDTANTGTPYSYAVDTADNEFLIYNYKDFHVYRNATYRDTDTSVNDGSWHHIVVTWRDSDDQLDFYKDNVDAYSNTLSGDGINQGGSLVIAQEQDSVGGGFSSSQSFIGYLDEIRIYNRTLTSSEISDLYNNYGYTTSNYPGKVLVRKYVSSGPQQSFSSSEEVLNISSSGVYVSSVFDSGFSEVNYLNITWSAITNANTSIKVYTRTSTGQLKNWWNTDWNYKKEINITSGNAAQNYQVRMEINTSKLYSEGKIKNDCSDLRFVSYDSATYTFTELPYWIEGNCEINGNSSMIWVKVDELSSGTTSIWMYYGNDDASPVSNASAVFDFFDDFNSLDSSVWGETSSSSVTVSGGELRINAGSVYSKNAMGQSPDNYTFEVKAQYYTQANSYSGLMIADAQGTAGSNSNSNALSYLMTASGTSPNLQMWGADGTTSSYNLVSGTSLYSSLQNNYYYILGFSLNASNIVYFLDEVNYSPLATYTVTGSWSKQYYLWMGFFTGNNAGTADIDDIGIDWVRIRKYIGSEPITAISSREYNISEVSNEPDNYVWSLWYQETNGTDVHAPDRRYIQYKILMNTSNSVQTPQLNGINIKYRVVSTGWNDMQSSGTLFTASSPYNCGVLDQSDNQCSPSLNVIPHQAGEFLLRLCTHSSTYSSISTSCSSQRNISVWIQPQLIDFSSSADPVAKGTNTTLTVKLVSDDGVSPLTNYNLSFVDETGNGSVSYTIGTAETNSNGIATIVYHVPMNSSLGSHTINISFSGLDSQYILSANLESSITISSKPDITDVSLSSSEIGFGYNEVIKANVTDEKGLDSVRINITDGDGNSNIYTMTHESGNMYNYTFTDTWHVDDYTITIIANNTDGIESVSNESSFSVKVKASIEVATEKENYKNKELVKLEHNKLVTPYSGWIFRKQINISAYTSDLQDYQIKVELNNDNFAFSGANSNGSDIRFTYYNSTSGNETKIPYWIQEYNATAEHAIIWVKVPFINSSSGAIIYLYYGKSDAESESNGTAVFDFFDDFDNGLDTTNKWYDSGGSHSITDGVLRINTGGLSLQNALSFNLEDGYQAVTRMYFNVLASGYSGSIPEFSSSRFTAGSNSNADATVLYMRQNGAQTVNYWIGDGSTNSYNVGSGSTGWTSSENEWYITGVSVDSGTVKLWRDGSVILTSSSINWVKQMHYLSLGSFYGGTYDIQDTSYDWVYVRKYKNAYLPTLTYGSSQPLLNGLSNTYTTNFKGYLRMLVQRWTGSVWQNILPPVLDSTLYEISSSENLNLSKEWLSQGAWNTSEYTPGKYRVYAVFEDPSHNILVDNNNNQLVAYHNFTIVKSTLVVTNLTHENEEEDSISEYETGDIIDWINVSVKPKNNSAFNVNVTLTLLDSSLDAVGWGPNETKYCGDLNEGEICEKKWDNSSSGYPIPLDATSGSYTFFWNVNMQTTNGDEQDNNSYSFTIHNLPNTFQKVVGQSRLYKPNWTYYNFTFTNQWTKNLTNAVIKINCPQQEGLKCVCIDSGTDTCNLGNIENNSVNKVAFNISVNESTPSDDYSVNITLNYTNPGGEEKSWEGYSNQIIEVRTKGILVITAYEYPTNVTRNYDYDFKSKINNTGDDAASDVWLNYTLPGGWSVSSGTEDKYQASLAPDGIMWNNITAHLSQSALLGSRQVRIDSGASDGRNDWKILYVNVFANTTLSLNSNQSLANRGDSIKLTAVLKYDNGSAISGETINFSDQSAGIEIGSAVTNSQGTAEITYTIPETASLGYHTFNATFYGDSSNYIWPSFNTSVVDIHQKPSISSISVTPNTSGYGRNFHIEATITDDDDVDKAVLRVTYPNGTTSNYDMNLLPPNTYFYNFNNTWQLGKYNFTIRANDTTSAVTESNVSYFTVNLTASMAIRQINYSYDANEYVNLTSLPDFWWNDSWQDRVNVNITNTATDLNDYQVRVSVNLSDEYGYGIIKDDCSDVRVTYYNSTLGKEEKIPYWIEACEVNSSGRLNVWAKVPLIKKDEVTNIYVYFNNPDASSESNGSAVFEFFDDFSNGLDTNVWYDAGGVHSVTDGILRVNSGGIGLQNALSFNLEDGYQALARVEFNVLESGYSGSIPEFSSSRFTAGSNSHSDATVLYMRGSGAQTVNYWIGDGSTTGYNIGSGNAGWTSSEDEWYVTGVSVESGTVKLWKDWTATHTTTGITWSKEMHYISLGSFAGGTGGCQDTSYDWVLIRKFNNSDPSVSVVGKEFIGSKISNTGATNFSGYLLMKVQYNNSGTWQDVDTIVDDISSQNKRSINSSGLNLAEIWNPISWSTGTHDAGTYRVYAALMSPFNTVLELNGGRNLSAYSTFEINPPELKINISSLSIYDVTDSVASNWHYYTNDFTDSGLNKTFNLYKDHVYRFEISVSNVGDSSWLLNSTNISFYYMNTSWGIDASNNIWYSNATLEDDKRSDTTYEGGLWNGNVTWNTTGLNGVVQSSKNATFFFIVNVTSTGDYNVNFHISHKDFTKNDYSVLHVIQLDTEPPKLYNGIYNLSNSSIFRGDSTRAYARWDEAIAQANVTYTTTSNTTWVIFTNTSISNPENWTNFTVSTSSTWFLGKHDVKILAKDESGNWNDSLNYLVLSVWGKAQVSDGNLNDSTIELGNKVNISCKVTDATDASSPIANYIVYFYNSTSLLGTDVTGSDGWAHYVYTSNSPGTETLRCNISKNETRYYDIDSSNFKSFTLTTQETEPPYFSTINGPSLAHKGDYVNLDVLWHDNYELKNATLSVNATGTWENESTTTISETDAWANFTYQIPTAISPGDIQWKQYAHDAFGNINTSTAQTIEVWGWAEVSSITLNPASIQTGDSTTAECQVTDANSSTALSNYNVSFWLKNSTQTAYTFLGYNTTSASGWANYTFVVNIADSYTVKCNITDDSIKKYNASSVDYKTASLNVVSGTDVTPPSIVGGNYTINDTDIMRNECVLISGLWDESINISQVEYDEQIGSFEDYNITPPYTNNWTNKSVCTNTSWQPGNHSIKLIAKDQAGNINNTLPYKWFVMWGRAQLEWVSPTGNKDRGVLKLVCRVKDYDTNQGIDNYSVTFYDGDLGYSIGSSYTNSTGYASIYYNFSDHNVGPDQLSCSIGNDNSRYYKVYGSSTIYNTIYLYGYLFPDITNPTNNSIIHKGTAQELNSSVVDENGDAVKDENNNDATITALWFNSSGEQIASGENVEWNIPSGYPLGNNILRLNESADYYHSSSTVINVTIYGYANITWIEPNGGVYKDTTLNLTCFVQDTSTGNGISGYPVQFFDGASVLSWVSTNSTGYATYSVSTSALGEGIHNLKCRIYDNATLYYNRTILYEANTTVTVDTTNPVIYYNSNSDASGRYGRSWALINITASDSDKDTVKLYWNGAAENFAYNDNNVYWTNKTGLSDGTYSFYAWVNDTAGNTNQTGTRTIIIDTTNPLVTIISPENKGYENSLLWFNVSSNENLSSCWYSLDSGTNTSMAKLNNTYYYKQVTVSDGSHTVKFYCNDTVNNVGNASVGFTVDTTPPTVTLNYPADYFNSSSSSVEFNCTASDNLNLVNVSLYGNFTGSWAISDTNTSPVNGSFTLFSETLSDGTYIWNCKACDDAQCSFASSNYTLVIDTNAPEVTIENPINKSYASTTVNLNYTASDSHLQSCWYQLDSNSNVSLPGCNDIALTGLSEGSHTVIVYANDSAGNKGSANASFKVDVTKPGISIQTPVNESTYTNSNDIDLNYSVSDNIGINNCWYSLDGGANTSLPNCANTTLLGLSNANHTLTVYVNDTAGNINSSSIWFNVSVSALVVTPESPANNSFINHDWIWANATTNKQGYGCNYSIDGGVNHSMTNDTSLHWWANATGLSDGLHNITFHCADALGSIASSGYNYFTIDTINPELNVSHPVEAVTYPSSSVGLNYTASDTNSITCYYSLDSGSYTELAGCSNTTLTLSDGYHNVSVKVVDAAENVNESLIQFYVDTTAPAITVVSPENITYTNQTLWFNVSSNENLSSCWYSLDSGTSTSMTRLNSTYYYLQVTVSDGSHTVKFYCNDTVNNIGNTSTEFTVDTTGPVVSFVSPTPSDGGALDYNWTYINITTNEATDTAILEWHNSTGNYNYTMNKVSSTRFYYNKTLLPDGTYYYKVYTNDTLGNKAETSLRSVIISTKAPIIYIESPTSDTYDHNLIALNVSSNKEITRWWFLLNNRNFTFNPNITITALPGNNSLTVFGEDASGKTGNTTVSFTVNAEQWDDKFNGFTGVQYNDNITINGNASIGFCWPLFSNNYNIKNPDCWKYRREINISSTDALTDYQVKLVINLSAEKSGGKVRTDCGDLRFSYINSSSVEQVIPYWIQDCGSGSANTTLWLKVPAVASGTTRVYMYYGNSNASTIQNASNVFEFFDDFNSVDSSVWGSNAANWEASNSSAYPNVSGSSSQLTATYTYLNSYATEIRFKGNSSVGVSGYYRFGDGSGTKNLRLYLDPANNRVDLYNGADNYYTVNTSEYHYYTLVSDYSNNNYKLFIDSNDTAAITLTSASAGSNIHPLFYSYYVSGLYLDWIAIRKYNNNEPAIDSIGAEETPKNNASVTSVLIQPYPFWRWKKFYASTTLPSGSSISFELRDANNNTLCSITSNEAASGYDICSNAQNYDNLYLYAYLDTSADSPVLLKWNITWEARANVSFVMKDRNGNVITTSTLVFYNSTNDVLAQGNGDISTKLIVGENYTLKSVTPAPSNNLTAWIYDVTLPDNRTIEEYVINDYNNNLPSQVSNVTSVFVFNGSGYSFRSARLIIPKNGLNIDYVLHCTAWDYENSNCTQWVVNDTSDYDSFGENSSYAWFNVTDFDAYTLGSGGVDLILEDIVFNNTSPEENENISVKVNVSNAGATDVSNTVVQLNISMWNGSAWIFKESKALNISVSGDGFNLANFSWIASPGTYKFYAYVDPADLIDEINETNNDLSENYTVPEWEIFYGLINSTIILADASLYNFSQWLVSSPYGNLYFADSDFNIDYSALKPLNGTNDLQEADSALNITGFNDSITALYDRNNDGTADSFDTFTIAGVSLSNVPIVNTTNSSNFQTGLLWDSNTGDSSTEYDGSQYLVIVTKVKNGLQGKYGTYDYEIRVPSALKNQVGTNDLVSIYLEMS